MTTWASHIAVLLLRGLLGHRRTVVNVLADIRNTVELACTVLDPVPNLTSRRRSTLGADVRIDVGFKLAERVLHVAALGKTSTEESGVDAEQDPRSTLEEDGG